MASKNKRSNYLIDKSFQLNFIVKFISLIVCCALLSGAILAVYYYIKHDMVLNNAEQVYLLVEQPKTTIAAQQPLTGEAQQFSDGTAKFALLKGALYFVDGKTLYPVHDSKKYRLDAKNRLEEMAGKLGAEDQWVAARAPKNLSVVSNKLGQMLKDGGKLVFSEIKPQVRTGEAKIDYNSLKYMGRYDLFELVWPALLFSTLLFVVISVVFGIFFTHRLAGPIYRISISLDRMLAGDYGFQIKLRRTDAFQHIAAKLNALIIVLSRSNQGAAARKPAAAPAARKPVAAKKSAAKKAPRR